MAIDSRLTAGEAVIKSLRIMGVLGRRANPSADQMAEGLETLNWLLKSMQANVIHQWRKTTTSVTISAGVQQITLDPRPVDVFNARLQFANQDYERPMSKLTWDDYKILPNKEQSGDVVLYAIQKSTESVQMFFWPVPNAENTVVYDYARVIDDITDAADTIDVLQEWLQTVYYLLASDLLTSYGLYTTSPQAAQRIEMKARELRTALEDADRPAYYSYGPGYNQGYNPSWG